MLTLQILAALGFVISFYAYSVERKAKRDSNYRAMCDIKESMSCTKAFTSPYGKLFGLSNALGGLLFYPFFFVLTFFDTSTYLFMFSLLCFFGTLFLAYISYIKMRNFCIVCHFIYLINLFLFIFSIRLLLAV